MENLVIKNIKDVDYTSPNISLDVETGVCLFSGVSFMENTDEFYKPIVEWIENFIKKSKFITILMKIRYFNSSSSKIIYELLLTLNDLREKGADIKFDWYYDESDYDMEEDVANLIEDSGFEFKMIPVNNL